LQQYVADGEWYSWFIDSLMEVLEVCNVCGHTIEEEIRMYWAMKRRMEKSFVCVVQSFSEGAECHLNRQETSLRLFQRIKAAASVLSDKQNYDDLSRPATLIDPRTIILCQQLKLTGILVSTSMRSLLDATAIVETDVISTSLNLDVINTRKSLYKSSHRNNIIICKNKNIIQF